MLLLGQALQALLHRYLEPPQFRLAGSMTAVGDVEQAIAALRGEADDSFVRRFADL